MSSAPDDDPFAALRITEFRYFLSAVALATLAGRALTSVVRYQVYDVTNSTFAIGCIGLAEVIPAVLFSLIGGHLADRLNRRRVVLAADAVELFCALLLAVTAQWLDAIGLWPFYVITFLSGVARGLGDPARSSFETLVVPRSHYLNSSTWIASTWQACSIIGPAVAGFAYATLGPTNTYLAIAVLLGLTWLNVFLIRTRPQEPTEHESILQSIREGVRFVWRVDELIGSMCLDLFAVFFGGAVAMIPVYAKTILKVGPEGAGLLWAAPAVGSLLVMLISARFSPLRSAGRNLLFSVIGFGVAMIVFGLSTNFWLSLAALAVSGGFDGVSVIIRKAIVRVKTPDQMRGRVSAVSTIFIASSNELGEFESGMAATLVGIVPSVVAGGVVTLLIAAGTAIFSPKLRTMSITRMPLDDEPSAGG